MGNAQWGHGFHKGKQEGIEDGAYTSFCGFLDIGRSLDVIRAMAIITAEYEVGEHGHDGVTYLSLIAIIKMIDDSIERSKKEKIETIERKVSA
jgi:hypothetical protein